MGAHCTYIGLREMSLAFVWLEATHKFAGSHMELYELDHDRPVTQVDNAVPLFYSRRTSRRILMKIGFTLEAQGSL